MISICSSNLSLGITKQIFFQLFLVVFSMWASQNLTLVCRTCSILLSCYIPIHLQIEFCLKMSWIPENIVCIVYYTKGDFNLIITYLAHCRVQNIWCATRLVQSKEITRAVGTGGRGGQEGYQSSLNPISIREQIMPIRLLLAPPGLSNLPTVLITTSHTEQGITTRRSNYILGSPWTINIANFLYSLIPFFVINSLFSRLSEIITSPSDSLYWCQVGYRVSVQTL